MVMIFSLGTLLFAAIFALRLLPKLVGLAFWLASMVVTGSAALAVLYMLAEGR